MKIVALIPAHNEAGSIEATLRALLAQERIPDKIVVIADNCTDDTFERASEFSLVTVFKTVGNLHRKSGALNMAWHATCRDADLVMCLDADTELPPHAVRDWESEFAADPYLGGSSSKFTMLGTGLLVRLQRAEFSKWTDTGLRRRWTSVLAGTGCVIRNAALREIAYRADREGPWTYASMVEDFELTYRIRQLGYHCHISPTVRAYTDAMRTVRSLWAQRMKWQVGTVEDLLSFGVTKLTYTDWRQQAAGMLAAAVRVSWVAFTLLALANGSLHMAWLWLVAPAFFIANDVKQALRIPHRDRRDVLLAALLLPQEFFAWLRAGWFLAAWCSVLTSRVTRRRKDRWAMQYVAEGVDR
jgi:cellulose synthase/poly-beta-1,6-N-acetylglucosamine synthase-like glycosyltransferase